MNARRTMTTSFEEAYPNITRFVEAIGYITIGHDDSPLPSFIRAIDFGGMVWEGQDTYQTLEEAFQDLEAGLGTWMREEGIEQRQKPIVSSPRLSTCSKPVYRKLTTHCSGRGNSGALQLFASVSGLGWVCPRR